MNPRAGKVKVKVTAPNDQRKNDVLVANTGHSEWATWYHELVWKQNTTVQTAQRSTKIVLRVLQENKAKEKTREKKHKKRREPTNLNVSVDPDLLHQASCSPVPSQSKLLLESPKVCP